MDTSDFMSHRHQNLLDVSQASQFISLYPQEKVDQILFSSISSYLFMKIQI